jgi:hypothetical protein
MTTLRTALEYEIAHISEYGEATLTRLNRQPEVIAPVRERYRISVMKAQTGTTWISKPPTSS